MTDPTPTPLPALGPEWQPCVKLPITVHVREQRPGESHVCTREGITPVREDDLIMRGVQGEEYPIGREVFNSTYRMGEATQPAAPDWRALCKELLQPLAEYDGANPYHEHRDLITRTRAALATQPAATREAWDEFVRELGELQHRAMGEGVGPRRDLVKWAQLLMAATREAGPVPQAGAEISDEEWDALKQRLWNEHRCVDMSDVEYMPVLAFGEALDQARAVLAPWWAFPVPAAGKDEVQP